MPGRPPQLGVRLNDDWRARLRDLVPPGMEEAQFVRDIIEPVLAGRLEPVYEGGKVVAFVPIVDVAPVELSEHAKRGGNRRSSQKGSTDGVTAEAD